MRRRIVCTACGQSGHNRRTCGLLQAVQREPKSRGTKSDQAAVLAMAEAISLNEAARRSGTSGQAVNQSWRRLYGDWPTPTQAIRHEVSDRALEMTDAGHTSKAIAKALALPIQSVRNRLKARGVKPIEVDRKACWQVALEAIAGGATIAEAAARAGKSYSLIAALARKHGVKTTADSQERRVGKVARALKLVQAGASVPEACRIEECAPVGVYVALRRQREAHAG
jgi:hypothetical protein